MTWVKKFAKSSGSLFKGQVLEGWQPIDYYHFYPMWYDLWIARIAEVIRKLDLEKKDFEEIKDLLPPPSNISAILLKMITAYYGNVGKNREDYRLVSEFFVRMLREARPDDVFCLTSNPCHNEGQIKEIISKIDFQNSDLEMARSIGRLITSAGSLVHGLYNDIGTDLGWEVYGPYDLQGKSFLIRHFPNLKPTELWTEDLLPDIKEIKIYTTYENIDWELSFVGCHTVPKGESPVTGMRQVVVYADGKKLSQKEIDLIVSKLADAAANLYRKIKEKDIEDLKEMVINQECYQLKLLFDVAHIEWRPTEDMMDCIRNKDLFKNIFPHGKLIETDEEFFEIFGMKKFEQDILK